jgi:hypothetical protein
VAITRADLRRCHAQRVRRTAVAVCRRLPLTWGIVTFAHSSGLCGGDDADAARSRLFTHSYALTHDSTSSMKTTGPSTAHSSVGRGITTENRRALLAIISLGAGRAVHCDLASFRGASSGCRRLGLVGRDRRTPGLREFVRVRRSQAPRPGVSTACGASGQERPLPGVAVARRARLGLPAGPAASPTAWTTRLEFTIISGREPGHPPHRASRRNAQ